MYIASKKGHAECVQSLLSGGAAINQATVGPASSIARHCGCCVCGCVGACVQASICSWFCARGWYALKGLV